MTRPGSILTEEEVGNDGPSKLFRALAIALALVAVVNVAARFLLDAFSPNRGYWLVRTKWQLLLDQREPADWLILGDSSCNQGVRPDVFEEVAGGRALNLCTLANLTLVNDAWMLEAYLERQKPPTAVVLVHVYDIWHRSVDERFGPAALAKIPLGWGYWHRMDPAVHLDAKQTWQLFATRYVPLYAENETLGRWIQDVRTFHRPNFRLDARGYMPVFQPNPSGVHTDTAEHLAFVRQEPFSISNDNLAALNRIVALADQRGFDVYIADSPMHDALARDSGFLTYHGGLRRMLAGVAAGSPHVKYLLQTPMPFPDTLMENSDHIVDAAAYEYTRRLASVVRNAHRWSGMRP